MATPNKKHRTLLIESPINDSKSPIKPSPKPKEEPPKSSPLKFRDLPQAVAIPKKEHITSPPKSSIKKSKSPAESSPKPKEESPTSPPSKAPDLPQAISNPSNKLTITHPNLSTELAHPGPTEPPTNRPKPVLSYYNIIYRHNASPSQKFTTAFTQGIRIYMHSHSLPPSHPSTHTYSVLYRHSASQSVEFACKTYDDEDSFVEFEVKEVSEGMRAQFGGDPVRLEWMGTRDDFGLRFVRWKVGREGVEGWDWGFARMGRPRIMGREEGRRLGIEGF